MAKRTDRNFKRMCRRAVKDGYTNTQDGKWVEADRAEEQTTVRHQQAGYKVGEFDIPRKKKEDKTGCCRDWIPGQTFEDRGLGRRGRR